MTRRTRRIFFYSSIGIFVVVAPLLAAYSLGYIFHPFARSLEQTGGIFIKSKTPRISLFIDGSFIKETSYLSGGALLTDIKPGTHRLRLEKQDHHSWAKTITVEPSMVEDFRNIILVPNTLSIATTTKKDLALLRASATTGSFRPIAPKETMVAPNRPVSTPRPDFYLDSKRNLINRAATTTDRILISSVNSFDILDGVPYFIDKNGFLGKIDPSSKNITTIGRPGFYLTDTPAQFAETRDGRIVIVDASGGFFLSDGFMTIQTITGGVRQFLFDSNGKKILLRKNQSVEILWLEDNAFQPFQPSGTREQVYSGDEMIDDADWFYKDDAHIVIRSAVGLLLSDIDPRDGKNIVNLFAKRTDELITIPEIPDSIFFRRGKTFYTIAL